MRPKDLEKFIDDFNHTSINEVKILLYYALDMATDPATRQGNQPMWKDLARLLRAEINRY